MSRSVGWRRTCPDQIFRRIEQALEARCYILRDTGPTGFLVKEDGNDKKYKVSLLYLDHVLCKFRYNLEFRYKYTVI